MSDTSPFKSILKTSLPAVVDLSSQTIMWTIEAILIGRISEAAFAGVGMAIQVVIVFFTVLLTFIVGSSIIINRHLGGNRRWEANHILGQALMISIVLSIIISLFWYFGATHIFKLIKEAGTSEGEQAGVAYLRTVAVFGPLIVTNFIAVGIIRGTGDTHLSMIVNMIVNGLNLALAPLLIFGWFGFPRWEVQGAALAVGISHSVGFLVTLYLLRTRKSILFLSFKELTTPNFQSFKRLFNTGVPTTVEQLVWATGQLVVSTYAAMLGVTILATHMVFVRMQAILSMCYLGFSLGAMTLMGKNLGADEHHLAERTANVANRIIFVFVLIVSVSMVIFSKQIITIFNADEKVLQLGSIVIKVFALVQIPKAVGWVLIGNLRGAGDLKWIMWITVFSVIFFEIGLNWIIVFIFNLSLLGLWLVHCFDESSRLAINYWRFRGGSWKFIDV